MMTERIEELYPTISIANPRTIVKAYNEGAFKYHMLTPTVMQCAEQGDEVALDIITRSAKHLVELPQVLKQHYKKKPVPVALMGGIIDNDTLLAGLLLEEIKKDKDIKIVEPQGTALNGAYRMALNLIEEMD